MGKTGTNNLHYSGFIPPPLATCFFLQVLLLKLDRLKRISLEHADEV